MTEQHRHCKCGAIYRRTKAMAPRREMNSFECLVCGETMESWNTAWVPTYRLSSARCVNPVSRDHAGVAEDPTMRLTSTPSCLLPGQWLVRAGVRILPAGSAA